MILYTDVDPKVCAWANELVRRGLVPHGDVVCRSIKEWTPDELRPYTQVHHFAGILGWPYALQLAGWPADRPVWTASCPCQPFSSAGKRKGADDERHLWPDLLRLVRACRPVVLAGEQVASAVGHGWLDGVFADLEAEGYACGAVVLGAHSVGAPHIRQRIYWVADAGSDTTSVGRSRSRCDSGTWSSLEFARLVQEELSVSVPAGKTDAVSDGLSARLGILRGAGNAIVPQVAAEFIKSYLEVKECGL